MVMTIVRVTLVFAGTAAYLGLAILGWARVCARIVTTAGSSAP
jgi:hypothetical protein